MRSDISEHQAFLTDATYEIQHIRDRIAYAKEHKLKGFKKLEKSELVILKRRVKRAEKSMKELQAFLALAENTLG